MKRLKLINGDGLITDVAMDTPDRRAESFDNAVMAGRFRIEDDPSTIVAQSCLCSRGEDECWHCGRKSKP